MVDDLRIVDLHEREVRTFPRSEIVDYGGRSLILPETRSLAAIDVRDVADGVQVRATGLIGFLPLTTKLTLNIRPKFPLKNLWHMLDKADETYNRILPIIRQYQRSDQQAPHQLLARAFCHFLSEILGGGVVKAYPRLPYTGFFAPKVNFGKTVSRYLSRGDQINCVADTFSFSASIPANAVLKAACSRFYDLVPRTPNWVDERAILDDALSTLSSVSQRPMSAGDIDFVDAIPMRLRHSYRGALTAYSVLAGFTQMGFSFAAEGSAMPSFLFGLDEIFESFVRNVTRDHLLKDGISVLDGNTAKHNGMLFVDSRRFPTKPDLIFRRSDKTIALAEVKYKSKLVESDRYQLISHTIAAAATLGVWISPANSPNEEGLEYIGSVTTGAKFYHYRMGIGADLSVGSAKMTNEIRGLVQPLVAIPLQ